MIETRRAIRRYSRQALAVAVMSAVMSLGVAFPATAQSNDARLQMQRALNEEVMASPFDPGDVNKAKAYAEEAIKKNIKPVAVAPGYWQPGWTCANLVSYRYYRYRDYRNCIYHHRYYGRYW